jgi:hypothetical protein
VLDISEGERKISVVDSLAVESRIWLSVAVSSEDTDGLDISLWLKLGLGRAVLWLSLSLCELAPRDDAEEADWLKLKLRLRVDVLILMVEASRLLPLAVELLTPELDDAKKLLAEFVWGTQKVTVLAVPVPTDALGWREEAGAGIVESENDAGGDVTG